jgi:hypothetical protein
MFAILASTTIGCVGAVYLATSQLVDASHRFRPDRVTARSQQVSGMFEWLAHKVRTEGTRGSDAVTRHLARAALNYIQHSHINLRVYIIRASQSLGQV